MPEMSLPAGTSKQVLAGVLLFQAVGGQSGGKEDEKAQEEGGGEKVWQDAGPGVLVHVDHPRAEETAAEENIGDEDEGAVVEEEAEADGKVTLERVVEEEKRKVARLEKEVVGLKSKMNIACSLVEELKKQLADASSMLKKDVMAMNALSQSATPVSVRDVHQLSTDAHEKVCHIYICMYACVCA